MMLQNQGKLKEVEPVLQRAVTSEEMHASQNVDDVAVYCFGDSQAEVLDYVFHKDPRYRTWHDRRVGWRSGWSARGLYTKANMQRILVPVSDIIDKLCNYLLQQPACGHYKNKIITNLMPRKLYFRIALNQSNID